MVKIDLKNMKNKLKNAPLKVEIEDDQIVLRIGVSTNAFCALRKNGGSLPENVRIKNENQFAKDVIDSLNHENEIGETLITKVLDTAIEDAYQNGSTAMKELKRKPRYL